CPAVRWGPRGRLPRGTANRSRETAETGRLIPPGRLTFSGVTVMPEPDTPRATEPVTGTSSPRYDTLPDTLRFFPSGLLWTPCGSRWSTAAHPTTAEPAARSPVPVHEPPPRGWRSVACTPVR